MLIALHKPFAVLCQFSDSDAAPGETLADYVCHSGVYPAGRLDRHSEGLLLLTDDGALQHQISHPKTKTSKEYWVQLEKPVGGAFDEVNAVELAYRLCAGITLKDGRAAATSARPLATAADLARISAFGPHPGTLAEHRNRGSRWFAVTMTSGRNRIVRRLCAAHGHPVLRLVRVRIGRIELGSLKAGESRAVEWRTSD